MAHIHEKIDFCVGAYIVHDQKVLLVDHKKLQNWMPVGGHVELDEDTDQALFREIEEESGIKPEQIEILSTKRFKEFHGEKNLWVPNYMDIHRISDTHQHIGLVFFCRSKTKEITLAEGEHNDIRWFSKEELLDPAFAIRGGIAWYATEAIKRAN